MREAEKPRKLAWAVERGGPGGGTEETSCLAWVVEQMRTMERIRENERRREAERKVKFLGFWVVLFVLICDCFVVNLLDRICSLSDWFLVCLENNNVIFGQWFYLEPMFNWIYQNFCLLVKRMCQIFVIHLKLFFFFFCPYYPFFSKILGYPSTWGP